MRSHLYLALGAAALIALTVPAFAQPGLEEVAQEESVRSFDQVDLDAIRQLAAQNALAAVPEKTTASFNCIPTCTPDDGRFLVIANGPIFVTLSDPILDLQIQVPAGTTSFSVGIFDGDGNEPVNSFGGFWDQSATAPFTYTLFADALSNGADGDNSDDTDSVVFAAASATLPNNAWLDFPVSPTPGDDAESPSGNFFYNLRIELTDLSITTLNAFKIRTSEIATIEPFAQPFSYIGQWTNPNDIVLIYPNFPSDVPKRPDGSVTYNGDFSFFFRLAADREELIVWGGDFDYGKFDGTVSDTDDLDTPVDDDANPATPFPEWQTPDGVPEGVAVGSGSSTGSPPDDNEPTVTLGPFEGEYILRRPSVFWDLIAPGGSPVFMNLDASGNQEWEQFVVSADPLCDSSPTCVPTSNTPRPGYPCADVCTGAPLPAGTYEMRIRGVDMQNLNAVRLPERVVCVSEFGLPCQTLNPFLIGTTVFSDLDDDGVQDGGEPGIPGVIVNLRNDEGDLIAQTVTDAAGNYEFNVPAGTFTVEIDAANFDPPAPGGALGDRVWLDVDGDGVQDAGEPGIPNVTVALFELGPDLTPGTFDDKFIATTQTGQGGNYLFADLAPGTYFVNVEDGTVPAGLALSGGTDPSATRTITTDEVFLDLDFGYANGDGATAVVGDFVWADDGDGIPEPGEPGIAGVTVDLIDSTATVVATAITGDDGKYLFAGVAPGTYTVEVTDLGSVLAGYTLVAGGESNPNPTAPFAVAAGDTILTKDFGYANPGLNAISDVVWLDVDRDGVLDAGESGIGGVRINLVGPSGGVVATTTTAADGTFTFPDLPDGDYVLVITDVDRVLDGLLPTTQGSVDRAQAVTVDGADVSNTSFGWVADGALEGLAGTTLKDPVGDVDAQIDTVVDDNVFDYDFGYSAGSLGNRVWRDLDGDGVQDAGEPGLNGVTVELLDAGGTVIATTVTAGDGNYTFSDLPGGGYTVRVTRPTGLLPTFDLDGTLDDETAVTLGANQDRDDVDFGYRVVCALTVEKTCQVIPDPQPFVCSDAKPLDVLTMIWNGTGTVDVKAWKGDVGSTLLATVTGVAPGDEVSVPGYAGSPNDVVWEVFAAGSSTKLGESTFHLSCSDDEMDGAEDCGSAQGNGKGNDSGLLNDWLLEGLAGNGLALDCTATPPAPAESCEAQARRTPSCEELDKPDSLTFVYTGGSCLESDNDQGSKTSCEGSVNGGEPATVTSEEADLVIAPTVVSPGEEFTVSGDFGSNTPLTVTDSGGSQTNEIHTSCSAPLAVGDVFGALELVAFSGQRDGAQVVYGYALSNAGSPLTGVTLVDDKLGPVGGPIALATGASASFSVEADVIDTTINRVDVTADPILDVECTASDEATVTITGRCEPAGAPVLILSGDEVKWDLTNNGILDLTISKITLTWPAANGVLKEVKLGGDVIFEPDRSPPTTVIDGGWKGDPEKRTLLSGDGDQLKFKFDNDAAKPQSDYTITVEFEEGCSITITPPPGAGFECSKPIDRLTMVWDGTAPIRVKAWKGDVGSTLLADVDNVPPGGVPGTASEVSIAGFAGSPNDVTWEIFAAGTSTKLGESQFHLSCSDNEMNDFADCGKRQGDGKGDDSSLVNDWIFEGMVDSDETLDCTPGGGPTSGSATSRVSASLDDVEERLSDGDVYTQSSDLELIDDSSRGPQIVGMRFRNLAVPQGATITSAHVEFETDETDSGAVSLTIRGQAADDAPAFVDAAGNVSSRATTAAAVGWSPPPWSTVSEKHQTPDLSAIIQEIVDRAGWASGNAMVILVTGSGERTAESYDGEAENAPLLVISYTAP